MRTAAGAGTSFTCAGILPRATTRSRATRTSLRYQCTRRSDTDLKEHPEKGAWILAASKSHEQSLELEVPPCTGYAIYLRRGDRDEEGVMACERRHRVARMRAAHCRLLPDVCHREHLRMRRRARCRWRRRHRAGDALPRHPAVSPFRAVSADADEAPGRRVAPFTRATSLRGALLSVRTPAPRLTRRTSRATSKT